MIKKKKKKSALMKIKIVSLNYKIINHINSILIIMKITKITSLLTPDIVVAISLLKKSNSKITPILIIIIIQAFNYLLLLDELYIYIYIFIHISKF